MASDQHSWGREHRRDGVSEWPSTNFSTLSGELRDSQLQRSRRRGRRATCLNLALPFLVVIAVSYVGVLMLANRLHG